MENKNLGGIDKYLNKIIFADYRDIIKDFPDKCIDLILTDPPYGGDCEAAERGRFKKYESENFIKARRTGEGWAKKYGSTVKKWNIPPTKEEFEELFRISKNQIIWGGNYFTMPPTRCFLVWDKLTISENFSMAMAEYAWTSFNSNAKRFECQPQDKTRFHPTQKPLKLFEWCLKRYAKPGDIILDNWAGSCTTAIVAYKLGLPFICFESEPEYYEKAVQRFEKFVQEFEELKQQQQLFNPAEYQQEQLFNLNEYKK